MLLFYEERGVQGESTNQIVLQFALVFDPEVEIPTDTQVSIHIQFNHLVIFGGLA
jgi:hypothetical protein